MPLAIDDIIRVKWEGQAYNEQFQWQQTFRLTAVDGAANTLQALYGIASFFSNDVVFGGPSAVTTAYLNMLGSSAALYRITAQRLLPSKTIYVQKETAPSGTGGTGPRATNTCAVFTLTSAAPGRSQLAKFHIGPLADSFMVAGGLSTAALTNLRALAQAAQAPSTATVLAPGDTVLQPVILHRNVNANPRFVDVASYRINFYVRTQRRRTVKIGK